MPCIRTHYTSLLKGGSTSTFTYPQYTISFFILSSFTIYSILNFFRAFLIFCVINFFQLSNTLSFPLFIFSLNIWFLYIGRALFKEGGTLEAWDTCISVFIKKVWIMHSLRFQKRIYGEKKYAMVHF